MGMKIRLEWFDKSTEVIVGQEYSKDLGDDGSIIEKLGLSIEGNVNNGAFDVEKKWMEIIKPFFTHKIEYEKYDYFVSFDYEDKWPEDDNNKQG